MDLAPEPDTKPLYPTPGYIAPLLSTNARLSSAQKSELVSHSLTRSCVFGDFTVLSYLLADAEAREFIDLLMRDDDGLGLISLTIIGFGAETERDVEREECVRLLVTRGADLGPDNSGWTPLHYGALASPATLVSYLMTHGCSPFSVTRRNLTPLDIVTGHTVLPGREDVALLLSEAMRGDGWAGSRMDKRRKGLEERIKKKQKLQHQRDTVAKTLGVDHQWWQSRDSDDTDDESDAEDGEDIHEHVFTPMKNDYSSQLVFSPDRLPEIFDSLITNFPTYVQNAQPANSLYMLARFACINCDDTWLEDLILGAADVIEETVFNRPDDIPCLVFWLYNTTTWLHLMQCDSLLNDACDNLGIFELIEEIINSVFVFIIRFAERKVDQMLDAGLLDYTALPADLESVQFESEWSFLRPFSSLARAGSSTGPSPSSTPSRKAPSPANVPLPPSSSPPPSSTASAFSSIRQSIARARAPTSATGNLFQDLPPPPTTPSDVTAFFTALQTLLTDAEVNPVLITQIWSQVLFWTSCEIFNRILTRKKYLCRSRSIQIGMNIGVLEEWVGKMGLPQGVQSHLLPVRDLLHWLQCLSSVQEFPDLIATVQSLKHINPLQMRRAVRDYRYEVNENRMPEECIQYLGQLQKDWERHRVHLGVEVMRKEVWKRQRDDDDESVSSITNAKLGVAGSGSSIAPSVSSDTEAAQHHIDMLFDRAQEKSAWEPAKAPAVLGELLDSRHMLPLLFPSDPRLLATSPEKVRPPDDMKRRSFQLAPDSGSRSASRASAGNRGAMAWKSRARQIRKVPVDVLQWVDGVPSASRWGRPILPDADEHDSEEELVDSPKLLGKPFEEATANLGELGEGDRVTRFTRRSASGRIRSARPSVGDGEP